MLGRGWASGKIKVQPAEGAALVERDAKSLFADYDVGPHWPWVLLAPLAAEASGMKMGCDVKPR
jgi:hypothetical protein